MRLGMAAVGAICALLCTGCANGVLDVNVDARYEDVRANLLERHLVNGVVVSLGAGKQQPNNRDALLHTSLTLASLPCGDAPRLLAGIAALELEPGRYVRYFDYPSTDQISRDMIIGLVFGLAQKYRECPALRPEIKGRMRRLLAFIAAHDDSLGTGPAAKLTAASRAGIQFAAKIMGLHAGPTPGDRGVLAAQAALLPLAVLNSGMEFYAVHLTSLELLLWSWAEPATFDLRSAQGAFCRVTEPFRNALYDGLCGRTGNLQAALQSWRPACYVYRWQSSTPWQGCDPEGIEHPGHDFLILYQLYVRMGQTDRFVPRLDESALDVLKPIGEVLLPSPEPRGPGWAW